MNRKTTKHRAFDPDPNAPEQLCDMPGCCENAGYRAPQGRDALNRYFWFCLAHVREYNAKWDFYKGMSATQIEAHIRADTSWQRPTWRMGNRANGTMFDEEEILDPLDILGAGRQRRTYTNANERKPKEDQQTPEPLRRPLSTLGLTWPLSLEELKSRYKMLARKHHPDANGGDREAEERLKDINVAYTAVRAHLTANANLEVAE